MITVACVYRSGGDFVPDDVATLAARVREHIRMPHRFCCLTDKPEEVVAYAEPVLLLHDWPGWWPKMELFRLSGPVLYFDLDTWLVSPVDQLCQWVMTPSDSLLMLRGFYRSDACSGVMAWNCDLGGLTDSFEDIAMAASWPPLTHGVGCNGYGGDQDFIRSKLRGWRRTVVMAQDIQPGIYSYKVDVQPTGRIPHNASIVCFHGKPRPWEVTIPEKANV